MKTAVIVAAGKSSRLYPLTLDTPKGLLEVNDQKILKRSVELLKQEGIEKIYIVVGYLKEMIISQFENDSSIEFIYNPFYEQCNNMGSLWFASHYLNNRPFLYLHGDIIYEASLLRSLLNKREEGDSLIDLLVDTSEFDEESMKVTFDNDHNLVESSKEIPLDKSMGEWIGIAAINKPSIVFSSFENVFKNNGLNFYDTYSFALLAKEHNIKCISTHKSKWIEVDFLEDYERAKEIFCE